MEQDSLQPKVRGSKLHNKDDMIVVDERSIRVTEEVTKSYRILARSTQEIKNITNNLTVLAKEFSIMNNKKS